MKLFHYPNLLIYTNTGSKEGVKLKGKIRLPI